MAIWFQTLDGKAFHLDKPTPDMIDPEVLATVLSRLCRFGGHVREFYSVAQHSLHVCEMVTTPCLKLPALLHDAHEAYSGFGDVCRPSKAMLGGETLKPLERRIDTAIARRFNFPDGDMALPEIKEADNRMLSTEARDLLLPPPMLWGDVAQAYEWTVQAWPMEVARERFLERLNWLTKGT